MTNRKRIAITVASALALAVTWVAGQWSPVGSSEAQIGLIAFLTVCGLTVVGVAFVNRWWALLPALSTVGVAVLAAAIYTPPDPTTYESYALPPVYLVVWLIIVAAFFALFLALGLLARVIWDGFRLRRRSPTEALAGRRA